MPLKQCPWFLECTFTFHTVENEKTWMQECPIDLHAYDVDVMDNEEEVAKKVDKPSWKGIQKYGSKTK